MHTHTHTHTCTYERARTSTCMHILTNRTLCENTNVLECIPATCMYACINVRMYACTHVCMYARMHARTHVHPQTRTHSYVHLHRLPTKPTHTHTHILTPTHTPTPTPPYLYTHTHLDSQLPFITLVEWNCQQLPNLYVCVIHIHKYIHTCTFV